MEFGSAVGLGADEHAAADRCRELTRHTADGPVIDDQTELRGRNPELAVGRSDPEVACHDELRAGAEGRAVDGRDHRRRQAW